MTAMPDAPVAMPPKEEDKVYLVADAIRTRILTGGFLPHERLVEASLAERFDANRAIVRTAIYLLEREGLVQREQNRGARVRLISREEALEIAEVRIGIEALIARKASAQASEAEIAGMRRVLAEMHRSFEEEDLLRMSWLNGHLHALVREASDSATLGQIAANLKHRLVNVQFRPLMMPGRADRSLAEHEAIVEAIAARDPDGAEAAMRRHLENVRHNLGRTLARAADALL